MCYKNPSCLRGGIRGQEGFLNLILILVAVIFKASEVVKATWL